MMNAIKFILILAAAIVFPQSIIFGQISESENVMSKGSQPSFSFTVDRTDERTVFRTYRSYIRSEYRERPSRDRRNNEWVAEDVNVVGIDARQAITIYAKFQEAGGAVSVNLWFEMDGDFLSSAKYPTKREGIVEFIEKLRLELKSTAVENVISEQESELSALERQLNRLKRDKSGYEKDIKDAERKIVESKANIEKNLVEQKEIEEAIKKQREKIQMTQRQLRELN
nr:hypothetical protein [Saprospiraceae bacterium]